MFSLPAFKVLAECSSCILSTPPTQGRGYTVPEDTPPCPNPHPLLCTQWRGVRTSARPFPGAWSGRALSRGQNQLFERCSASLICSPWPVSAWTRQPVPDSTANICLHRFLLLKHLQKNIGVSAALAFLPVLLVLPVFTSSSDNVASDISLLQEQPAPQKGCTSTIFSALPWWIGTQKWAWYTDWLDDGKFCGRYQGHEMNKQYLTDVYSC